MRFSYVVFHASPLSIKPFLFLMSTWMNTCVWKLLDKIEYLVAKAGFMKLAKVWHVHRKGIPTIKSHGAFFRSVNDVVPEQRGWLNPAWLQLPAEPPVSPDATLCLWTAQMNANTLSHTRRQTENRPTCPPCASTRSQQRINITSALRW